MKAKLCHRLRRSLTCRRAGFGMTLDFDWIFFMCYARVILNRVKELSSNEGKIVPSAAKVPQLLKGRIRDDIGFLIKIYFFRHLDLLYAMNNVLILTRKIMLSLQIPILKPSNQIHRFYRKCYGRLLRDVCFSLLFRLL